MIANPPSSPTNSHSYYQSPSHNSIQLNPNAIRLLKQLLVVPINKRTIADTHKIVKILVDSQASRNYRRDLLFKESINSLQMKPLKPPNCDLSYLYQLSKYLNLRQVPSQQLLCNNKKQVQAVFYILLKGRVVMAGRNNHNSTISNNSRSSNKIDISNNNSTYNQSNDKIIENIASLTIDQSSQSNSTNNIPKNSTNSNCNKAEAANISQKKQSQQYQSMSYSSVQSQDTIVLAAGHCFGRLLGQWSHKYVAVVSEQSVVAILGLEDARRCKQVVLAQRMDIISQLWGHSAFGFQWNKTDCDLQEIITLQNELFQKARPSLNYYGSSSNNKMMGSNMISNSSHNIVTNGSRISQNNKLMAPVLNQLPHGYALISPGEVIKGAFYILKGIVKKLVVFKKEKKHIDSSNSSNTNSNSNSCINSSNFISRTKSDMIKNSDDVLEISNSNNTHSKRTHSSKGSRTNVIKESEDEQQDQETSNPTICCSPNTNNFTYLEIGRYSSNEWCLPTASNMSPLPQHLPQQPIQYYLITECPSEIVFIPKKTYAVIMGGRQNTSSNIGNTTNSSFKQSSPISNKTSKTHFSSHPISAPSSLLPSPEQLLEVSEVCYHQRLKDQLQWENYKKKTLEMLGIKKYKK